MRLAGTKFHDRSLANARREVRELKNRYEGAQPSTPKRAYLPAFNREARFDANSWTRWEMTRKVRYFERNLWFFEANGDEHVKWTIGPNGLAVVPFSSDEEWNKSVLEAYTEWGESPCVDSTVSLPVVHGLIARAHHFEEEIFILKDFAKDVGRQLRPAIQLIESHRCSSPGSDYSLKDQPEKVDGVEVAVGNGRNPLRPVGYWFIDNQEQTQWAFRPIESVHHVFSPTRPGMYRPVTRYHSVIESSQDFDELEKMAMEKAKNNARFANFWVTASGELPKDALRSRKFNNYVSALTNNDTMQDDYDKRLALYRQVMGAATVPLRAGESLTTLEPKTPTPQEQWHWFLKIAEVSKIARVPFVLLLPELIEKINGTLVRSIFDSAHEGFKAQFFIYAKAAIDIYRHWLEWAIRNDKRCFNPPLDYKVCHVTPPRAVNVDIGYTSQAKLEEYAAGFISLDDIAGMQSTTPEALIRKKGKNVFLIKKVAKELTELGKKDGIEVKPEEISCQLFDVQQPEPEEPDGDEKEKEE